MSILYAIELAVIAAAIVGMFWLRRKADAAWRARQRRLAYVRITLNTAAFTTGLARAVKAAADLERSMRQVTLAANSVDIERLRRLATPHDYRDDATAIGDSTGFGGPVGGGDRG